MITRRSINLGWLSGLAFALGIAPVVALGVPLPNPVAPATFTDTPITGTTSAARPELAGTIVEDVDVPYNFSGAGFAVAGVVQNRVVQSDDGTIDFYWRIIPDVESNGEITALRVIGFDGFALDADFRTDGLGDEGPTTARNFGGGAVNFLFAGVAPDEESLFFFLDTQATAYAMTGAYDLLCAPSECVSPVFATFAPVAAVIPEPPVALLLALGLVGLALARKRASG